jgi:hypothetical protein
MELPESLDHVNRRAVPLGQEREDLALPGSEPVHAAAQAHTEAMSRR